MKPKPLINGQLLFVAAICCAAYIASLKLIYQYNIQIGVVGQALAELFSIPIIGTSAAIFIYSIYLIISGKKVSPMPLLSLLCLVLLMIYMLVG